MKKEIIVRYVVDVPEDTKDECLEEVAIALINSGRNDHDFVYDEACSIFYNKVESITFQVDDQPEKDSVTAEKEFFNEERMNLFEEEHGYRLNYIN